jgi:hypothetical protein
MSGLGLSTVEAQKENPARSASFHLHDLDKPKPDIQSDKAGAPESVRADAGCETIRGFSLMHW